MELKLNSSINVPSVNKKVKNVNSKTMESAYFILILIFMMKCQIIHHRKIYRVYTNLVKIYLPRHFIVFLHNRFKTGFKEKVVLLFRSTKSQYFIFLKYWLFFESEIYDYQL